ncbi:hypothetical protein H072_10379 [Dactylellina haptotyla CBS 200.50]|uniref:Uncharacterized protein n=1 Tax=Dactylellina haptotyla (strain CBS 200.50) TaxID=1284197 RepID=S8A0A8_DACHA|nr:hypothetical protein H072_10379 [Dactylellina haptotyla CBS 200.50]
MVVPLLSSAEQPPSEQATQTTAEPAVHNKRQQSLQSTLGVANGLNFKII